MMTSTLSFAAKVKISNITQQFEDLVMDLQNDPVQLYEAYTLLQTHFEHTFSLLEEKYLTVSPPEQGHLVNRCSSTPPSSMANRFGEEDGQQHTESNAALCQDQKMFSRVVPISSSPSQQEAHRDPMNSGRVSSSFATALPENSKIRGGDVVRLQLPDSAKPIPSAPLRDPTTDKIVVEDVNGMGEFYRTSGGEAKRRKYSTLFKNSTDGVWISVWPCFGTHSASFSKPTRVFVRPRYRYMEDVTEVVAKSLNCQPAPTALYEPQGREIRSLSELRQDGHYLFFPSGGFYRREAVPVALLNTLIEEAKKVMRE